MKNKVLNVFLMLNTTFLGHVQNSLVIKIYLVNFENTVSIFLLLKWIVVDTLLRINILKVKIY